MEQLIKILAIVLLIAFAGLGIYNLKHTEYSLELKEIELKSTSVKLKELDLRYDKLNQQLDHSAELNKKQLKELEKEKSKLEKDKKKLEEQLQAKREAKAKERQAIAKASRQAINTVTGTTTANASSGTKEQWMASAGIPKSDWYYVDCVINGCDGVSPEGGWHGTQRWNTAGSGAYGLCQSLPASKMASEGADYMTNPVTQLRWCHKYAQQYGGWKQAWNFRKCIGYCYSTKPGVGYINKDHTWW